MFIRKVKTRTTDKGINYYSYRLVDTYRSAGRVRQRTLMNLGSHFSFPQAQWPELTQRIEQILEGQSELIVPESPELEEQAQSISHLLLRKYSKAELLGLSGAEQEATAHDKGTSDEGNSDLHTVDLNSLEYINSRTIGAEALAFSALSAVDLPGCLKTLGFNRNQLNAAVGNIVGRMVLPGSELSTHDWLQKNSALGELLDFEYEKQGLSALYRVSDQLWSHHDAIEQHLYQQHMSLIDTEDTITLYDLTNTFFEGTGKYNDLAAYGHSKERRNDCPLVTLALVLGESGFVRHSRIFAGNASEPATLQQMIEQLRQPVNTKNNKAGKDEQSDNPSGELDLRLPLTIVMDAGIASEDNIQWLVEQGYKYIVVSRKRQMEFDEQHSVVVKEHEHDSVQAMRVERENGEIELYCHSALREKKERGMSKLASERLESELNYLAEGLHIKRRLKNAKRICEKVGRLRQKYSSVSRYYEITIETDDAQKNATELNFKRIEPKENDPNAHPGVYCLRSNQTGWDEQQMWSTYIMLTDLEAVFRSLKSELGMRPVYHQKTHRVEGHIFITLLGYNLVHQIRCQLKQQGIDDSWETIRTTMSTQMRITTRLKGKDGEQIYIRKSVRPNVDQQRILTALNLEWLPGKTEKVIVTP